MIDKLEVKDNLHPNQWWQSVTKGQIIRMENRTKHKLEVEVQVEGNNYTFILTEKEENARK